MSKSRAHTHRTSQEHAISTADSTKVSVVPGDDAAVLARLVEGTVRATGKEFFQSLVEHLAQAIDSHFAFVAKFAGSPTRARTLAYWAHGRIEPNIEWELRGTPCEEVIGGRLCHHPANVCKLFPQDEPLVRMGIQSYMGVPLVDSAGCNMGHLAVFDERPMPAQPKRVEVFRIFAGRAAAELERLDMERQLHESERRYRDLFDEAPIGYVYEDTETRFVSANRAAQQILGLQPDEVRGTVGLSLVAPTQEAQERVHRSLAAEQAGKELPFIELELRRKDNGKPVWVQRFSRPEPDGRHTRTMIIDITDRVLAERERARLLQQNQYLREEIKGEYNFEEIIGSSPALRESLARVKQVAPTDSTVLILGETGTGKELIARAIHNTSRRRDKPLIKLNCAALPTGLIESELFGHEKGAFTGAVEKRVGRFTLADGGTIFLDEIGDIPADVQVRLLRVLQEHEFEPVGSPKTVRVDVRVIAATNRNLEKAVADRSFRADLFYRLNVFPIELAPLRQRREDIPVLIHYFVGKYAMKIGKRIESLEHETLARLSAYDWPGNIRELENVIERALILTPATTLVVEPSMLRATRLESSALPDGHPKDRQEAPPSRHDDTLDASQRRHIVSTLDQCRWVIEGPRGAARILGLHPNTLRSRMKKLGIARGNDIP
jgi:formate hydrogenlyase transcriptional activator